MKVRTSFLPILSAAVLLSGTRTGAQTPSNAITLSLSPDAAQVKQKIALTANVTSDGIAAPGGTSFGNEHGVRHYYVS